MYTFNAVACLVAEHLESYLEAKPGPEVLFFPFLTQLSTNFILLINVKMPTIVVILTFISMTNTTFKKSKKEGKGQESMEK